MDRKPIKGDYLDIVLRSLRTVFTTKDVTLLWNGGRPQSITSRLHKYAKAGKLVRICRGIYGKDATYDRFELATRIYTPSYISFETVLTRTGINFQYYKTIFVASYVTRDITVDGQYISIIRLKDDILCNTEGIDHSRGYAVATKERAMLDRLYVSRDYHFDNIQGVDWQRVFELLPIYHNKRMNKKVKEQFEQYKTSV